MMRLRRGKCHGCGLSEGMYSVIRAPDSDTSVANLR